MELVGGGASGGALVAHQSDLEQRATAFRELAGLVEQPVLVEAEDRDLLQSELVKSVVKTGTRIQIQAAMGANADEHLPVREGGLVLSADGMHWSMPVQS